MPPYSYGDVRSPPSWKWCTIILRPLHWVWSRIFILLQARSRSHPLAAWSPSRSRDRRPRQHAARSPVRPPARWARTRLSAVPGRRRGSPPGNTPPKASFSEARDRWAWPCTSDCLSRRYFLVSKSHGMYKRPFYILRRSTGMNRVVSMNLTSVSADVAIIGLRQKPKDDVQERENKLVHWSIVYFKM